MTWHMPALMQVVDFWRLGGGGQVVAIVWQWNGLQGKQVFFPAKFYFEKTSRMFIDFSFI